MSRNTQQEMDLFDVLERIGKFYQRCLGGLYKATRFVFRNWIPLLILGVGGYFLGAWWEDSNPKVYETKLVVQNNFSSSNYIYDAIEVLNVKSKQGDKRFLRENGFDPENPEVVEVIIEPIVSVVELLDQQEANDRNLDSYMSRIDFEEEILRSEVFSPEYHYHRITMSTSSKDKAILDKVMTYLNNNDLLNQIKDIVVEETKLQIERNNTTIKYIDEVFVEFAGNNPIDVNATQMFFKSNQNNNLHQLVDKKVELIDLNETLRGELVKYDNVSTLINRPEFYGVKSLSDKKGLLLPIYLIFAYVMFFVFRGAYRKGKKYTEENN